MRSALIIANTEYTDPGLAQLTAPGKDAEDFARVLRDKEICAFDEVNVLLNEPEHIVRGTIDEFFDQKKPNDLLVLYFSGHGVRDELGSLYLAVKNTIRNRLRSTAIKSDYIREAMDQSRSKRQVLILDCCNSGAFSQGTKAATGVSIGTASEFEAGYGRIILTASDSTQFAWEGDKVIGETDNSLFTHFLVEGLEGEADLDGDGSITVDELYDYVYEMVKFATPKQTPSKFSSKQQGEIFLRQNIPVEVIKPVPLPTALLEAIENPFPDIRLGVVHQLTKLLIGKNLGLVRSARAALVKIATEDDSRRVAEAAAQAMESFLQGERAKRETARKAKHENLRKDAAENKTPEQVTKETHDDVQKITAVPSPLRSKSFQNWALATVIIGGLCVLGLVLVRLGSNAIFPPSPLVPIALTFTLVPSTTSSFMAPSTNIPTSTGVPCFKLLTPENHAELQPTGNITFSWETMPGANKYRLEITMPEETVISRETDGLGIDYPAESIPTGGTYMWKVIAYGANEAILCTSGPFRLTKPEYVFPSPTNNDIGGNSNPVVRTLPPKPVPTFTRTVIPTLTFTSFPTPPPPRSGNPTVMIIPGSGPAGTQFNIQIDNFEPNETINIRIVHVATFETVLAIQAIVDPLGSAVMNYISPTDMPSGGYIVYTSGASSSASGDFIITPPPGP